MAVVLVVTSAPPLVEGGHIVIARALRHALEAAGHETDIVTTPSNRFGRQAAAYLANWCTDVGQTGDGRPVDHVISLRYPSYAVRHPRHVCWLNHTMREYYDLWDRFSAQLSWKGRVKEGFRRRLVHAADRYLLRQNVSRVVAQSQTIRDRLRTFGLVDADVLYPPPPPRAYRCDGYDGDLLLVSRLTPLKRVDLVLRALAHPAAGDARLVVAGDGEQRRALHELATDLGIADRVVFAGHLSDEELVEHLARCRAVVFAPYSEDFGFVTVEAFAAAKAVITTTDSGGPAELVVDGHNGRVVAPDVEPLAAAIGALAADAALAERLGRQGHADTAHLTWASTVERLLEAGMPHRRTGTDRAGAPPAVS